MINKNEKHISECPSYLKEDYPDVPCSFSTTADDITGEKVILAYFPPFAKVHEDMYGVFGKGCDMEQAKQDLWDMLSKGGRSALRRD